MSNDGGVNWGKVALVSAAIVGTAVVGVTYQPEISNAIEPIADGAGEVLDGVGDIAKGIGENLDERPAATITVAGVSAALGYKVARGK